MEILLTLGYIVLFCFIIFKWKWFHDKMIPRYLFIFLFVVKVAAGIFAGDLYLKQYKGGDTFAFFIGSQTITESFKTSPLDFLGLVTGFGDENEFMEKHGAISTWKNMDIVYNDNKTILRVHAIIGLFSLKKYFIHVVFFAFISMMGLMGIFKGARLLTDTSPYLVLAAVFLVPGVIFWLSMASKESILIFAMGMFFYHCIRLLTVSKSFGNIAGMFLAGFLFIHIKAYLLIMITPCLLAFTWVSVTNNRMSVFKYLIVYGTSVALLFNLKFLLDGFDPVNIVVMKRINYEVFATAFPRDMESYIDLPSFTTNFWSIMAAAPTAALAVFSRPYLWESESLLVTFAAIENVLIILSLAIGFIYCNYASIKQNKNLLLFCIFFVLTVFILIGLTTPVMGSMVRYKVPVLPFLLLIPILISGDAKLADDKIKAEKLSATNEIDIPQT